MKLVDVENQLIKLSVSRLMTLAEKNIVAIKNVKNGYHVRTINVTVYVVLLKTSQIPMEFICVWKYVTNYLVVNNIDVINSVI